MRKTLLKTAACAMLAMTFAATATANGTSPVPTPSPSFAPPVHWNGTSSSVSSSDSSASSRAGAAANSTSSVGSVAGGSSSANAQGGSATGGAGGAGGSVGDASSGASVIDNGSSRAWGIALPAPVQAAPLPSPRDCVLSSSHAAAGGWNLISAGKSEQFISRECVIALQVESLRKACQFDAANQLQSQLISSLGAQILPASDRNLTAAECWAMNNPQPLAQLAPAPAPFVFEAPAAAPACAIPQRAAGVRRKAAAVGCAK